MDKWINTYNESIEDYVDPYEVAYVSDGCFIIELDGDGSKYPSINMMSIAAVDFFEIYDPENKDYVYLNPKTDYIWRYLDYINGRIAIFLKNDIGSYYITVLDDNMEFAFEPIKTTQLFNDSWEMDHEPYYISDHYLYVSNTDENTVTVVNLETNEIEAVHEDSNLCHVDSNADLVWITTLSGAIVKECYDALTNEVVSGMNLLPEDDQYFHEGYLSVSDGFIDRTGKKLVITK